MNILYLCDEYPPGQHGGIGSAVRLLAQQMVKLGHTVVVAGLYPLGYGGEDEFTDNGVMCYRFRLSMDSGWFTDGRSLMMRVAKRLVKNSGLLEQDIKKALTGYQQRLEQLIIRHQIDLVEMPDYNDYIKYLRSYNAFPKLPVPCIVKLHGSMTYFAREAGKPVAANITKMERDILKQAAAVVAVSRYTAQKSAVYFEYDKPISVLNNGINTVIPAGNQVRNPQQVIFTGTLIGKKGIYQLAKAWNIVTVSKPDARLLVLGKGDKQKVIDYLSPAARHTVKFMGHVDTETLYRHLSASAISVFPSYAEAFALAPLEAMACGTAVINSARTSGAELIEHDRDGLLIDPDDIVQMASAIVYLLSDHKTCVQLAKSGTDKVMAKFGIAQTAVQNLELYNRVLLQR